MATKSKNKSKNAVGGKRSHDRSAMIQWSALVLVALLALLAAFVLSDGNGGGGGHSGAPVVLEV
ncbi:MAG: hypothetical protein ACRBK7_33120 [Acidimicrobiales bacterium]